MRRWSLPHDSAWRRCASRSSTYTIGVSVPTSPPPPHSTRIRRRRGTRSRCTPGRLRCRGGRAAHSSWKTGEPAARWRREWLERSAETETADPRPRAPSALRPGGGGTTEEPCGPWKVGGAVHAVGHQSGDRDARAVAVAVNVTSIVTSLRVVQASRAPGSQTVMVPRIVSRAVVLDDASADAAVRSPLDEPPRLEGVDGTVTPPLVDSSVNTSNAVAGSASTSMLPSCSGSRRSCLHMSFERAELFAPLRLQLVEVGLHRSKSTPGWNLNIRTRASSGIGSSWMTEASSNSRRCLLIAGGDMPIIVGEFAGDGGRRPNSWITCRRVGSASASNASTESMNSSPIVNNVKPSPGTNGV